MSPESRREIHAGEEEKASEPRTSEWAPSAEDGAAQKAGTVHAGQADSVSRRDRLTAIPVNWEDPGPSEVLAIVQELDDLLYWVDRCGPSFLYVLDTSDREALSDAAQVIHGVGSAAHLRVTSTSACR